MGSHFVVVYVHDASKSFTATARMRRARLDGVTLQTKGWGYRALVIATHLDKATADAMKQSLCDAYKQSGYTYRTRPPLPQPTPQTTQ